MSPHDLAHRLEQPVLACMSETFITLPSTATVREAAMALRDREIGLLMVTDGDELVGVFAERDVTSSMADGDDPDEVQLADRARGDIVTVPDTASLQECVTMMAQHTIRHLVVVASAHGQPVGVVSARDVLNELAHP